MRCVCRPIEIDMDWASPTTKKHIAEAEAQDCELLGPGKNANYRTYRLPCGHEREIGTGAMRKGGFRCQICLDNRVKENAEAQGCELLGRERMPSTEPTAFRAGMRGRLLLATCAMVFFAAKPASMTDCLLTQNRRVVNSFLQEEPPTTVPIDCLVGTSRKFTSTKCALVASDADLPR